MHITASYERVVPKAQWKLARCEASGTCHDRYSHSVRSAALLNPSIALPQGSLIIFDLCQPKEFYVFFLSILFSMMFFLIQNVMSDGIRG